MLDERIDNLDVTHLFLDSPLMGKTSILSGDEVVKTLNRFGWRVARQRGSHIILVKEGHIATLSVPNHHDVARGTLRTLISRADLTVEEFVNAM